MGWSCSVPSDSTGYCAAVLRCRHGLRFTEESIDAPALKLSDITQKQTELGPKLSSG